MKNLCIRIDRRYAKVETYLLLALVSSLAVLGTFQVLARNLFDWGDPELSILLRYLVLWTGLVGASLASQSNEHLAIDILNKILPTSWRKIHKMILASLATALSGLLAYAAWKYFLLILAEEETLAYGLPGWIFHILTPWCLSIMSVRFGAQLFLPPEPSTSTQAL